MGLSDSASSRLGIALGSNAAGAEIAAILNGTSGVAETFTGGVTLTTNPLTITATNIVTDATTGMQIATGATQKLAFWGATPIVQPANTVDYVTMLTNLGLRATGGTASATFPGAVSAAGNLTVGGAVIAETSTGTLGAAGTTNANGTALTFANNVITGADATKGVVLPASPVVGQMVSVMNTNGSSILKVYSDASGTGGTINGGSANASVSLAALKGATYVCTSITGANQWWSLSN